MDRDFCVAAYPLVLEYRQRVLELEHHVRANLRDLSVPEHARCYTPSLNETLRDTGNCIIQMCGILVTQNGVATEAFLDGPTKHRLVCATNFQFLMQQIVEETTKLISLRAAAL